MSLENNSGRVRTTISLKYDELVKLTRLAKISEQGNLSAFIVANCLAVGNPHLEPMFRTAATNFNVTGEISSLAVIIEIVAAFLKSNTKHALTTMETPPIGQEEMNYKFILEGIVDEHKEFLELLQQLQERGCKIISFKYKQVKT